MKKIRILFIVLFLIVILAAIGLLLNSRYHVFKGHTLAPQGEQAKKDIYYCPMHPGFTSDRPGDCAICGMKLVKKEIAQKIEAQTKTPKEICLLHNCPMTNCLMQASGDVKDCPLCGAHLAKERKILYYRNPMNPQATSPVPMKDSMGMDYVPVYEEASGEVSGINISLERQQMIGVKKEEVKKRRLEHTILTVGKVAYDPALYVAQQEYLQALKVKEKINESALPLIREQTESLVEASKKKLILLGMNEENIGALEQEGKPQENLYLPLKENIVWVYLTIYEYEIGLIKEGQNVEIEAVAFPGEVFKGKVMAITPVLDSMTRSIQVRAEVENQEHKLKPDMFVNARIGVDLGEKIAVSEEAVINTGKRTIVVVTNGNGNFFSKEVILGQKAEDFYEVLAGLNEGDIVITSGNFLIDSESRLQSAISTSTSLSAGDEHKHGQ